MAGKQRLTRAYKSLDRQKANDQLRFPGILGFPINGVSTVEIPDRPGYVYVRLRDNLNEVIHAYNESVSPVYGLPVVVIRDKVDRSKYRVQGRDVGRYEEWGSTTYLGMHGPQHSFDLDNPGGDIVWVWGSQFMPLAPVPSGSSAAGSLHVYPYAWHQGNQWNYISTTGTVDLLSYKPTGSDSARMLLVYLDNEAGIPGVLAGDQFSASTVSGTGQRLAHLPIPLHSHHIPIAGVFLNSGSSYVSWDNITDVRPYYVPTFSAYTAEMAGSVAISTGSALDPDPSYYFGHPDDDGTYDDGTWRIARSGTDLVMQRKESGSWVTKSTILA